MCCSGACGWGGLGVGKWNGYMRMRGLEREIMCELYNEYLLCVPLGCARERGGVIVVLAWAMYSAVFWGIS